MKTRWDLLPIRPLEQAARVMTFGVSKYGDTDTWRTTYTTTDCYASLMRHLVSWRKGEVLDDESGLHHMAHIIARACLLMEIEQADKHEAHATTGVANHVDNFPASVPVTLMEGGGHD